MSNSSNTWLYIKQHNTTGLKYFGRTTSSDPIKYPGSGTYWKNHLSKHGNDVTTVWCQLFTDKQSCIEYAIAFSKEHNIVESSDWANLVIEDGINGSVKGRQMSSESRKKLSDSKKGKSNGPMSESQKQHLSTISKGKSKQPFTSEHRKNISISHTGLKASEETKKKMSLAHKGKIVSDETREKISVIHKGKIVSDETREKISSSGKEKRWWNNGIKQTLTKNCPEGWVSGRIR